MVSGSGRYVIVYNGEVYNFRELKAELEAGGLRFRGGSDTEVILEACAAWGIEEAVARFVGMFAFALWDREERHLTLVRDRLGIKPLYWARFGSLFLFASELKSLRAHPGWAPEIDRDALAAFMRHAYVPSPHSIYRGVRKLEPGTLLTFAAGSEPRIVRYWDLRRIAREGCAAIRNVSEAEALEGLETRLDDAVRRRMVADVPLGAFLSGGYDSSTVVALMQAASERPVRTFTIGFHEADYDEARHAKAVARHLGTDHTELYVDPDHALDIIPRLADFYDEPFADSSQLPTFLVSELTRRHVTVALSGDGGDEVFGGYNRYLWADRWWRWLRPLPSALKGVAAAVLRALPPESWDGIFGLAPHRFRVPQAGDKIHKLADLVGQNDFGAMYRRLVSHWDDPDHIVLEGKEPKGTLWDETLEQEIPNIVDRMRFLDSTTYLPDDILTKVDRASVAVSLEARVPILDHRVVEFVWRLPARHVADARKPKRLLRRILNRHVPPALTDRPKMGFGVPIGAWLRGPLRDWAEDLLDEGRLEADGILRAPLICRAWQEHLSGTRDWKYPLWTILMFQAWKARWM
jgi:asparagine synthase (glutamine-hydrolysing)